MEDVKVVKKNSQTTFYVPITPSSDDQFELLKKQYQEILKRQKEQMKRNEEILAAFYS